MVMPAILNGLRDQYDDVRAIAAASLLPVAKQLPILLPEQVIHNSVDLILFCDI